MAHIESGRPPQCSAIAGPADPNYSPFQKAVYDCPDRMVGGTSFGEKSYVCVNPLAEACHCPIWDRLKNLKATKS